MVACDAPARRTQRLPKDDNGRTLSGQMIDIANLAETIA
jgi:hypothetical protein